MPEAESTLPPAAVALDALGIPHDVFIHPGPVHSLEQAAEERDQSPGQVVRSILFRLSKGEFALVLMAGPQQIDWGHLRQHFNRSRLTMAKPDEVMEITGYPIGAVSPFGLPTPVPIIIDQSVLDQKEVSLGSGWRSTAIIIQVSDLLEAVGSYQVADLSV